MLPQDVRDRVRSYIQHQAAKSSTEIAALVSTSQQRFLDAVSEVGEDVAARKPAPDEWSLRDLIRHVIVAERGVARLVEILPKGETADSRRAAGMQMDDDSRPFAAYVAELPGTNRQLLDAIAALGETADTTLTSTHPFFGELNCREWAVFQRVHDEDHVQHAGKILGAVAAG